MGKSTGVLGTVFRALAALTAKATGKVVLSGGQAHERGRFPDHEAEHKVEPWKWLGQIFNRHPYIWCMQAASDSAILGEALLASFRHNFQQYKVLADRALAQISPEEWLYQPAPGSNSAAVIVQHLVGNLRSRFTDFLASDGEKPTRHRDQEFEQPSTAAGIPALQAEWQAAWQILFSLLDDLRADDLLRTVTIRGEAHTVLLAVQRQVAHYASHVGQLVQLAKIMRGENFQSLSIPRGQSQAFSQKMAQSFHS